MSDLVDSSRYRAAACSGPHHRSLGPRLLLTGISRSDRSSCLVVPERLLPPLLQVALTQHSSWPLGGAWQEPDRSAVLGFSSSPTGPQWRGPCSLPRSVHRVLGIVVSLGEVSDPAGQSAPGVSLSPPEVHYHEGMGRGPSRTGVSVGLPISLPGTWLEAGLPLPVTSAVPYQ